MELHLSKMASPQAPIATIVSPFKQDRSHVDCVVQATTWIEYHRVGDRLRALGFRVCDDEVLSAPLNVQVDSDLHVKVASHATFLATKFEAFAARGQGDYMASSDFEDAVTVIAYCDDIENLVFNASKPVRLFLIGWAKKLLVLDNLIV